MLQCSASTQSPALVGHYDVMLTFSTKLTVGLKNALRSHIIKLINLITNLNPPVSTSISTELGPAQSQLVPFLLHMVSQIYT